jgi:hypothetical protein
MFEALLALFFTATVVILVWMAKGAMLTPVPLGKGQSMRIIIHAGAGAAGSLEQTVEALKWLRSNGTLPINTVIIEDGGMDPDSIGLARRLAERDSFVELSNGG